MSNQISRRIIPLVACLISVVLCLLYAKFRGDMPEWWSSYGGGVPYVLFWILFAYTAFPVRRYILRICIIAVLVTCLLEVLQLWHPPFLQAFRATKFGAALLGSTFVWNDFPPYFIGGLLGYIALRLIAVFEKPTKNPASSDEANQPT